MKFIVKEPRENRKFSLIYRPDDFSFDIEPLDGSGDSSIMINDLQLEINYQGEIMYAWGLCPLIIYNETDLFPCYYATYCNRALEE